MKEKILQEYNELPLDDKYQGTIFIAESGRVWSMREKLSLLGFEIIDLKDAEAEDAESR